MTEQSRHKRNKTRKDTETLSEQQIAAMDEIFSGFGDWYRARQRGELPEIPGLRPKEVSNE